MPNGNQNQFDPITEFHSNWPNATLSDSQILQNLQDPAKFRSAFPAYTGVTDDMIRTKMAGYLPKPTSAEGPSVAPQSTYDKVKAAVAGPGTFFGTSEPDDNLQTLMTQPGKYFGEMHDLATKPFVNAAPLIGTTGAPQTVAGGVGKAVGEVVSSLTSPENIALMGVSGGLGKLGQAGTTLQKFASAGFGLSMIKSMYEHYKPFKDAVDSGNYPAASYHLTSGLAQGGLATAAFQHAISSPDSLGAPSSQVPTQEAPQAISPTKIDSPTPTPAASPEPSPIGLTDDRRAQISKLAAAQAALTKPAITPAYQASVEATSGKIPIEVAPEPVQNNTQTLQPLQQDAATKVEQAFESKQATATTPADEPLRQMVEDAGGKWRGSDSMGLSHYDAPPEMVGGRAGVSIASPTTKMTPDFVASEFQRKASDFALPSAVNTAPEAGSTETASPTQEVPSLPTAASPRLSYAQSPISLDNSLARLVQLRRDIDSTPAGDNKQSLIDQRDQEAGRAKDLLKSQIMTSTPEQLANFRLEVKATADRTAAQSKAITELADAHEANVGTVNDIRQRLRVGGPVRQMVIDESGNRATIKPESEVPRGGRDLLHDLMGEKPFTQPEDLIPRPKPEKVPQEAWDSLQGKLQAQRMALRTDISHDFEIMHDTKQPFEDTAIPDKLKKLGDIEKMIGTYPEAPAGRRAKMPTQVGDNGEILNRAPLQTITGDMANKIFGRNLRKMPAMSEFRQKAADLQETSRLHNAMLNAIDKVLKPQAAAAAIEPTGEEGKIGMSTLAGMAAGGAIGATHGPISATVGAFIGAMTPEVMRSKPVVQAMTTMKPIIDSIGVSAKDWLVGPDQDPPVNPGMDQILAAQKADIQGSSTPYLQRLAQIPNELRTAFVDRTGMLNDTKSALGRYIGSLDPRNRIVQAAGKSITDSPYITLRDAAKNIRGEQSIAAWQFSDMESTALKAGLSNQWRELLNLHVYDRVVDVLDEKQQDLQLQQQNIETKLQSPSNTVRQRIALEDDLQDTKKSIKDYTDRINSGDVNPQGYNPQKIQDAMQKLQAALGPDKMKLLDDLSSRAFNQSRAALDFAHDNHVVSDENYQKFTSRGNNYIPATRIMSDLAENTARWQPKGTSSDAYLRQQRIIKSLEGSDRVNRDPIVALQSFVNEAISEGIRNKVINEYILAAGKDPKTYTDGATGKQFFTPVGSDYKALKGEALIGSYIDGKPYTYAVPDWLHASLEGVSPIVNDMVGGATARFFQRAFSTGATTLNVGFSVMRPVTDLTRMALLSDAGVDLKKFPYDAVKIAAEWTSSLKSTILKDPKWQEGVRSGALSSGAQRNINPEVNISARTYGSPWKQAAMRIIDSPAAFNTAVEDSIKLTAFQRLRAQGKTIKEAVDETSRFGGAPDYSRKGNLSPVVNLLTMFFNADMQHITQAFEKVGANPKRMVPILGAVTAMQLALSAHNWSQKDQNGQPLMRMVPYTEREKYWTFLTGETTTTATGAIKPVRYNIRKPDFVGIFINPIDNLAAKVVGKEDRTGSQLAMDALTHLIPASDMRLDAQHPVSSFVRGAAASTNPALRMPVEEFANQQIGSGAPIVTNPKLDPRYQVGPNTSPLATKIGRATGVSPQKLDYAARALTGGVSSELQDPADNLRNKFTGSNMNQADTNLTKSFYDNLGRVTTAYTQFNTLMKTDPTQAQAYMQANKNDIWKGRLAEQMNQKLSEINQTQKIVEAHPNADPTKQARAIANLHQMRMSLMNTFNGFLTPETADKGTLGSGTR